MAYELYTNKAIYKKTVVIFKILNNINPEGSPNQNGD